MGKKKDNKTKKDKHYPLVSVCTPTYNRRPFIKNMIQCFLNQTYPKYRTQWIIMDDGTDNVRDLIEEAKIPQIEYFEIDKKMKLGEKRNFMHSKAKGSYIVYMDDDDYYPPERIEHAVEMLQKNPKALCAGSSELYIYFKHIEKMYQFGPYGPNHATAGTFAFRKELLSITHYNNDACLAEEKEFLHNYSIPFIQLNPLKTILVFSHNQNTFDKKKLLNNINPTYVKESNKTIDMFITQPHEEEIKDFFVNQIDELLKNYAPGEPNMKPDVLKQMKELEIQRKKIEEEQLAKMNQMKQVQTITTKNSDNDNVQLTIHDAVNIMNKQNKEIIELKKKINELEIQMKNKSDEQN